MAMNKDPLGDFMTEKDAAQEARMKKINPNGRKLDKNGNPIITKEELTKSGMTLREFMNKERGLTPRASAPKKAPAVKTTTYTGPEGTAGDSEAAKNSPNPRISAEARMKDIVREQASKERRDTLPMDAAMKKGGGVPKMKKGGSVRGDGCAIRGKTKGTMR